MQALDQLFKIQAELDQKIMDNHGLHDQVLVRQKCMALVVETAELANETRVFKYWSLKGPSASSVILEEYVDCLHFILSIGLDLHADVRQLDVSPISGANDSTLFQCFEDMFASIHAFTGQQTVHRYTDMFRKFVQLGQALQFDWPDIEGAYLAKNKVNHERQEQGY